jgi:hypothetical protein
MLLVVLRAALVASGMILVPWKKMIPLLTTVLDLVMDGVA